MSNRNFRVIGYYQDHAPQVYPIGDEKVSKKDAQRIASDLVQKQHHKKAVVVEAIIEVNA